MTRRVLYLVVCAAGPAGRIQDMVRLARGSSWDVYCIATPAAVEHFLDLPGLAELTGHQVRIDHRRSGDRPLPKADAVVVAPATYNIINRCAAGIADNYVLNSRASLPGSERGLWFAICEPGARSQSGIPRSVAELRDAGVRVLFGPGEFVPHPPRTGDAVLDDYPWSLALAAAGG